MADDDKRKMRRAKQGLTEEQVRKRAHMYVCFKPSQHPCSQATLFAHTQSPHILSPVLHQRSTFIIIMCVYVLRARVRAW